MSKAIKLIKNSLFFSKDCLPFTIFLGGFLIICSILFTHLLYSSHVASNKEQLESTSNTIDMVLEETLDEARNLLAYISKEISTHDENNLQYIEKVLFRSYELISRHRGVISYPTFNWVNPKNQMVIDKTGINLKNPVDVSHRSYTTLCAQHPWTLQVSRPTIGISSGLWIIPIAFGITNQKNTYIGALVGGMEIVKLSSKIDQVLHDEKSSYIVLDHDLRIIVQSSDNSMDPKSSYFRDILKGPEFFKYRKEQLENPVQYKNIEYHYYKKMSKYPYIILTGFDKTRTNREFISKVLIRLLELLGIGIFCLTLLYFFRKKLINLSYKSEKSRDTFLQQINKETQAPLNYILAYSDVLLKHLEGRLDIGISQEKQIDFLKNIYQSAFSLLSLTSENLNPTFFDVNTAISDCINIHYHSTLIKKINIKVEFENDLPLIYADELKFKQIVIGLISLGIEYTPPGGDIKVSTFLKTNLNQNYLVLLFEDTGFGLDIEDIERINLKYDETRQGGIGLSFASIDRLIKMHKGAYKLEPTWPCGKKFTVTLPFEENQDDTHKKLISGKSDNVYSFPPKKKA